MTGGVEVREKTLRGLPTAWLQAGPSGPAADQTPILLLFHGFPDGPECWDLQIAAFKDRYSIVAPFGRGAAPSAKGKRLGRYGPDAVALDVLAILDEVDPTRVSGAWRSSATISALSMPGTSRRCCAAGSPASSS